MSSILKRQDNETEDAYLVRLYSNMKVYGLDKYKIADLMNSATGKNCDESKWRKDYAQSLRWGSYFNSQELEDNTVEEDLPVKHEVEILKDGSQKSDKLIKMSIEDSKNPEYLLNAHGYNPSEWNIVSAKSSIWNQHNKNDGTLTLFSSKITVKPKKDGFDIDRLVELVCSKRKPIVIEKEQVEKHSKLLEIPLYDMHFGVSSLEYYSEHLNEIVQKIRSRSWEKVLFVIGQDLLHNNDFKGNTANGTPIEKVDMERAFDEALQFYETIIGEAIVKAKDVECIYVKGNHDETSAYGVFRVLKAIFPQVKFDSSLKQRKGFVWGKIFLGLTHGDKGANRLMENFLSEYGKLIAKAEVKEIHSGHLHAEKMSDKFGIVQRTLATANKTDSWHDDNGFIGANKRFQLFEYSPSTLDAIYYI
ncbi:hypothetical protein [uncultured Metabacillus sp.]|uniref:hypothetical protein n=1 Tax=uncultured Metabacillus sp. TaxID=2860135 RepID=UPI0026357C74|nr:hypothetical protein [uncultured Metabacillus sp.]